MGKRKKQQQSPQLHIHLHAAPPTEQSPKFSRRVFEGVLGSVLGSLVFERLTRFVPSFLYDHKAVTIQGPTIGPTSQTFPPSVEVVQERVYEGLIPLRINVSSSYSVSDSVETKLQSLS